MYYLVQPLFKIWSIVMNKLIVMIALIAVSLPVMAEASNQITTESGLFRMILGLLVVLALFVGLAWIVKRMVPKISGTDSLIKLKGGVSVGSRERVVVVQILNRLIVVGVAPGHVTALANLDASRSEDYEQVKGEDMISRSDKIAPGTFKEWLKNATRKI